MLETGDLIGVEVTGGTHGCQDYALLRYEGGNKATVIECQSCHSCWQVGHGQDHVFAVVGESWHVSSEELRINDGQFSREVKWVL